ncbi:MAG: hypothetical protein JST00_21300 [Deltaproteobacteria bacterium]|nr:hypothetical protein [Deltaproteobacteria bacterium]
MADLDDLLTGLMNDMRKVTDTTSMIGKPIKVGTSHMVPLLNVTIGFGTAATDASGSGASRGASIEGGGAGGTMVVSPKAFVVVGADGVPQLVTLRDGKHGEVQKAIELGANGEASAQEAAGKLPRGGK